jgi:hypothetical protein
VTTNYSGVDRTDTFRPSWLEWQSLDGDGTPLTAGEADAEITALIDGFTGVTRYMREKGIYSAALIDNKGLLSSDLAGGWEGWDYSNRAKAADDALREWQQEELYTHSAQYATDTAPPTCTIVAHVSAADDVNPDGTRKDQAVGTSGTLAITGLLPQDVQPDAYIEQQLEQA